MKPEEILFVLENYKKIIGSVRKIIFRQKPGFEYIDISTWHDAGSGSMVFTYWYYTEGDADGQHAAILLPISEIMEEL